MSSCGHSREKQSSLPLGSGEQSQISVSPQGGELARAGLSCPELTLRAVEGNGPKLWGPVQYHTGRDSGFNLKAPGSSPVGDGYVDCIRPMSRCKDADEVIAKPGTQATHSRTESHPRAKLNGKTSGWDGPWALNEPCLLPPNPSEFSEFSESL